MAVPVPPPPSYYPPPPPPRRRSLPFGWGAVTVLLVGAAFEIVGILMIVYAMFNFLSGTIGAAIGSDFSVGSFLNSFLGTMVMLVIGGVLAGIGGWLLFIGFIVLIVGVATGSGTASTVRGRDEAYASDVRVRCRSCGRLNPEWAKVCMSCSNPV